LANGFKLVTVFWLIRTGVLSSFSL